MSGDAGFDVVVVGEVLVEVTMDAPVSDGLPARIGFSGDAFNVAAAAVAAGARVALCAVLTDDELGAAIAARIRELGVSDALLRFRPGQQGVYLTHADPDGARAFIYARNGSVGSTISPDDLHEPALATAGVVVATGITAAISASGRKTLDAAAHMSRRFAYDPNFRGRLTTVASARAVLRSVAKHSWLVTPSYPTEVDQLLDAPTPRRGAEVLRRLGARNVAVTCGEQGVQLSGEEADIWVDAFEAPNVVDQTGAGDAFLGTLVARYAQGDDLTRAARLGCAAAALAVGKQGGAVSAGYDEVLALADRPQDAREPNGSR